ncbi:MAG: NAD(P)-dependent oxidoreductase [bacterium]|nr:NAD(P)-dependent oxidoreductase [bacterium]
MRVLCTGGSSFTGHRFIRELAAAGHEVHATFTAAGPDAYAGLRGERVRLLLPLCRPAFGCRFGEEPFMALVRGEPRWDLLCHHAADVRDYRSPDFDVHAALGSNTRNLAAVLRELAGRGCRAALLTGSVFENDEGEGGGDARAFSPYGLSKGLTFQLFRFHCGREGFALGKFVIPNPFGPYEEERFTTSLVKGWARGETPAVRTPDYVRDNIHVGLLAKAYVLFAGRTAAAGRGLLRLNPSGYAETQGEFTRRFAREMGKRLGLPCRFELKAQAEFPEPRIRTNTEPAAALVPGWDEGAAWDEAAEFYRTHYLEQR